MVARFWERVEKTDGCWPWLQALVKGYGRFWDGTREWKAHVYSWTLVNGPVPKGKKLDHLCHNVDLTCPAGDACPHRRCVRPDHLEPVAPAVNTLRGRTLPAANVIKLACPKGHAYTQENTRVYRGRRHCRACDRARGRWGVAR